MPQSLSKAFHVVRKTLDHCLQWLAAISMLVLVLVVSWQVIIRYTLSLLSSHESGMLKTLKDIAQSLADHSHWTQQLPTYLMIWVGLLGASIALKHSGHLGIDYFTEKLPKKCQHVLSLVSFVLIIVFSSAVMIFGGSKYALRCFTYELKSTTMEWLNMGWVYAALPISGFFMVIYSLEQMVDVIMKMHNGPSTGEDDEDDGLESTVDDDNMLEGVE